MQSKSGCIFFCVYFLLHSCYYIFNPTTPTVNTHKATSRLIEKGILENTFKGGFIIEDTDMHELRAANLSLVGDNTYTVLVQAEELINFSVKARELVASEAFKGNNIAKALLFQSLGQRIIANFYLKIHKPFIKTKLFSDREKALIWLRKEYHTYITENSLMISNP